jgi:hypothetical protein
MTEKEWLRLVYLVAVLALVWPATRMMRGGTTLLYVMVWLGILTAIVAGYVVWQG